jgi:hypothetical protein
MDGDGLGWEILGIASSRFQPSSFVWRFWSEFPFLDTSCGRI